MGEVTKGAIKQNLLEKLIEGYVKAPSSLKEQAILKLALQLCQDVLLKKIIAYCMGNYDVAIDGISSDICQKLSLPPLLKNILLFRIPAIVLQLYRWSKLQETYNNIYLPSADNILDPSDWTVDMGLDEKKIAQRFVQEPRIPVNQRCRMASYYCLESFMPLAFLWKKMSFDPDLNNYLSSSIFRLIQQWSYQLKGEELQSKIWTCILAYGIAEGSLSTVLYWWNKVSICNKQELLAYFTITKLEFLLRFKGPCVDILCFVLTQLSKSQRIEFFQLALRKRGHLLEYFIWWPYMDLFLPIINELWNVLPVEEYGRLLCVLASHYTDGTLYNIRRNDYADCDYGYLMIELLKEAPDHFKRYVFGSNFHKDKYRFREGQFLLTVLRKGLQKNENINVFKNIWQHVTLEERRSFLRLRETLPYKETLLSM